MIEIIKFELINKGNLIARFTVRLPKVGGMLIHDCTLFESGDKSWINLPSKAYEADGKKKYFSYISYEDRGLNDRFKESIKKAADEYLQKNCKQKDVSKQEEEIPF